MKKRQGVRKTSLLMSWMQRSESLRPALSLNVFSTTMLGAD